MLRSERNFGNALLVALIVVFGWRSLSGVDQSWDVLAYHLPFSLERVGLFSLSSWDLPGNLKGVHEGFPSAYDYFRGFMIYLTGSIKVINILNLVALLTLSVFARVVFKINAGLSTLAIITIPVVLTCLTTAMSDIAVNCLFAAGFLAAVQYFVCPEKKSDRLFYFSMAMFIAAANIKPQFVILAGFFGGLVACVAAAIRIRAKEKGGRETRVFVGVCAMLLLLLYYVPLRNLIIFHNPLYPTSFSIFGFTLPGVFAASSWIDPRYSMTWPQPVRWLLSIIEYRALDGRTPAYTTGMGNVPITAMSRNVGGSFGFYVVFLLCFIGANYPLLRTQFDRLFLASFAVLTIVVALFPGSHELRYFVGWQILLVLYTLILLKREYSGSIIAKTFYAVIGASFIFVNAVTGFGYLEPRSDTAFRNTLIGVGLIAAREGLKPEQTDVCLVRWGPLPFMFDNYFHGDSFNPPQRVFRIVQEESKCGDGVQLIGPY